MNDDGNDDGAGGRSKGVNMRAEACFVSIVCSPNTNHESVTNAVRTKFRDECDKRKGQHKSAVTVSGCYFSQSSSSDWSPWPDYLLYTICDIIRARLELEP